MALDKSEALPGSLPSIEEELWVIARPTEEATPATDEESPGSGALMAKVPGEEKKIPVPLKHTDVKSYISGYIATVEVTQQFHNPYDSKIEAVYIFPLPQNAAVNEFIMRIGDRSIRGIIREREEAERIYAEARRQGYVASLLTQERPNIFTQKVANIEPCNEIDINIKYFHTMTYVDGWYEYVFPMVVGPRFDPPGTSDGVGAVARGQQGVSGQKTEVQYLRPNERNGHDISLTAEINLGVTIEEIVCTSHVIKKNSASKEKMTVILSPLDRIPNKDFVLRYKVAGDRIKSALLTQHDKQGNFFALMLYPPENLAYLKRKALEMVFVLDCSGSMSGRPIAQAKAAIERALSSLQEDDTFQIIEFSNSTSQLGSAPILATPRNVERGLNYVRSLEGSGGTMMIKGIKAALNFSHDPQRLRIVSFMTDGYIGNEKEILAEVHKGIGASRIFSFGVGSSPNRYLLDRMAKIGKGAVAYLGLRDSAAEVMDCFFECISHPAMTDINIDWGNMKVSEVYPVRMPDLFVGRPVILTGRFSGSGTANIRVKGNVAAEMREIVLSINLEDFITTHKGLPAVWARMKIADLSDRAVCTSDVFELPELIKQVALEYGLMSEYTAFVAVDSSTRTNDEQGTTVNVPVPVPEGVRYETTVIEE
jgi:Ca-activated chloride channel family protein